MNKPLYLVKSLLVGTLFFVNSLPLYAQVTILHPKNTYWECNAYDQDDNLWIAQSSYERSSINKALDTCKKMSKNPGTCKVAKENCFAVVNGVDTRPMWQCTAFDQMAKEWKSAYYTKRDDAALGAKAFCQDHSGMPDTCYINLMTCSNKNKFVH
ncbi:Uncharacterised protein (plasmid) [Legionella adelaidensis]|uniref:DUF4189 domain-containing protein n=1 Tax=Legionella adelaidensis TaxID=45056 RepID=A0A0W0R3M5_9GAMM|nr:hypothetical protein [Legionella adelaidensis]KTC65661.1 hypothetical protein Lade_0319 [Legionella adelaidensis]VEH85143.1 Uncharacterised protein [Legionella adelaidensis]